MIISYREKRMLQRAESPNADPWNASDSSKIDKEGEREPDNPGAPTIVNLKINQDIKMLDEDRKFINWETLNQLDGEFEPPDEDDK